MKGIYVAKRRALTVTAAANLIVLKASANIVIEILSAHITNFNLDTNEQFEAGLFRVTTSGVGAASALNEEPTELDTAAAAGVAEHPYATTEPVLDTDGIDVKGASLLNGYHHDPIPEQRIFLGPSDEISLRLDSTITSAGLLAQIAWREIG